MPLHFNISRGKWVGMLWEEYYSNMAQFNLTVH